MGIENGRRGIVLGVVGGGIALLVDQVIAFLHSLPISEQTIFREGGVGDCDQNGGFESCVGNHKQHVY